MCLRAAVPNSPEELREQMSKASAEENAELQRQIQDLRGVAATATGHVAAVSGVRRRHGQGRQEPKRAWPRSQVDSWPA